MATQTDGQASISNSLQGLWISDTCVGLHKCQAMQQNSKMIITFTLNMKDQEKRYLMRNEEIGVAKSNDQEDTCPVGEEEGYREMVTPP